MKTIRAIPILALFTLSVGLIAETPEGELFFSVETTETAFFGKETEKNGIFFFREIQEPYGVSISGYRCVNGNYELIYGPGTYGSQKLDDDLRSIGFEEFDYEQSLESAKRKNDRFGLFKGSRKPFAPTFDGAKFRITIDFDDTRFSMERWNPNHEIEFFAKHDRRIHRLKEFIDTIALAYGKHKLQI